MLERLLAMAWRSTSSTLSDNTYILTLSLIEPETWVKRRMDHLEKIQDGFRSPLAIPFVSANFPNNPNALTFKDFENLPYKFGYSTSDLIQGKLCTEEVPQIASLLQYWLYFGLLIQTFVPIGITFNRDEFVRTNSDGDPIITTESLPKYLWFWLAIQHHQSRRETECHAKLVDSCLELTSRVVHSFVSHRQSRTSSITARALGGKGFVLRSADGVATQKIVLSLVILGETLSYARDQIIAYSRGPTITWRVPTLMSILLQEAGWCIAETQSLYASFHCPRTSGQR